MPAVNRRGFLAGLAGTAALSGIAKGQQALADPARAGLPVRQGTNMAAQISPDGRTIAMDTFGVLWLVPAAGGQARRITGDLFDIAQPDWSPDSGTIAFQSYRDGNFHIWTIRADGTGLRQLTSGPFDHREPRFSPDGKRIVFSSDLSGS